MSTDTLTADRLPQLLSSCRERAASLIQSHIQGEGAVGTIYEELERWYGRYRDDNLPLPQYQDLPSPVKDQLFDAWIEGVEGYFAKRAAESDSVACAASSPSQPLHATDPVKASPEGSVCEVEPLGEIDKTGRGFQIIHFEDRNGEGCSLQQSSLADFEPPGSSAVWLGVGMDHRMHLTVSQVEKLVPHLTAWLETGSFRLIPRPVSPSSDQSSLLTEARETLGQAILYGDHLRNFQVPGTYKWSIADTLCTKANATLVKLNTALGEEQKGRAGV